MKKDWAKIYRERELAAKEGFEQGLINGWNHTVSVLRGCIKAHKKTLKQIRAEQRET